MPATGFDLMFAHAWGAPASGGEIKVSPEDFQVTELPSYEISGRGEHVILQIRKTGHNTQWVAGQLARFAQISSRDVGFAGRKDRHAVTTQWFSCRMPGRVQPRWQDFAVKGVEIIRVDRHNRKLRPGALRGNHFSIRVRNICRSDGLSDELEQRLQELQVSGFPNYFGNQRFGNDAGNLEAADQLLKGMLRLDPRHRGLILSTARSWLFNKALSRLVEENRWQQDRSGGGSQIGSLYGIGGRETDTDAIAREIQPCWCRALEAMQMKRSYRALRATPVNFQWCFHQDGHLQLDFELARGCYATSLIREVVLTPDVAEVCSDDT